MKRVFVCLSLLILGALSLLPLPVNAQISPVPPLMNFQGRLARPDGTSVADGTYSIRFSLWDNVSGGTEKWNQTISNIAVSNGVFNVLLDVGTVGLFNGNLWLEIKIGTDAPLTPRQQLVSVAYAMKAESVKDGAITGASIANGTITADKLGFSVGGSGWGLTGNTGIDELLNFLGTTDNKPLVFKVNGKRAMRYRYVESSSFFMPIPGINILGGSEVNSIADGITGVTLAGGGTDLFPNQVISDFAALSGGIGNTAGGFYSVIGGGSGNTTGGYNATVAGGNANTAVGQNATVAGGESNTAKGNYSFAAGRRAKAIHDGVFVWADSQDADFASTALGQFLIRAQGGVGINTNTTNGAALNVAGLVQMTGLKLPTGAVAGKVLTSDADGNATWQTVSGGGLGSAAGGDLAGTYPNPTITANAVTTAKLFDNAVTNAKLASDAASLVKVSGGAMVNQSGNIGINTLTPSGLLDVSGTVQTSEEILDQVQTVSSGATGQTSQWQSFTAGISGLLTRIDLMVSSPEINQSSPGTLSLYEGEGTGGMLLATQSITYQPVSNTFQSFPLTAPFPIIAGQKYTIRFTAPNLNVAWVKQSTSNPYAGGRSSFHASIDLLFRTYVGGFIVGSILRVQNGVGVALGGSLNTTGNGTFKGSLSVEGLLTASSGIKFGDGTTLTTVGLGSGSAAGGDLSGTYPNPTIAANAVTNTKLADNAVTNAKILDGAITNTKLALDAASLGKVSGGVINSDGTNIGIGRGPTGHRVNVNGNVNAGSFSASVLSGGPGRFEADGDVVVDRISGNIGTLSSVLRFGSINSGEGIGSKRTSGGNQFGLDFYTGSTIQMNIALNGNVGIGLTGSSYKLRVNGKVAATGFDIQSDRRYKTNIHTFDNALDTILNLRGVTFDWKRDEFKNMNFTDGRQIGFIAQEVEEILPELVMTDANGYKAVAYANVVPILVEAVKSLQARKDTEIKTLKAENAELKKQLSELSLLVRQIQAAQEASSRERVLHK